MEKAAYIILSLFVIVWIGLTIAGLIAAMPYGLIGLIFIIGIGLLFIKVLKDRLKSKEDNYYSNNVDK